MAKTKRLGFGRMLVWLLLVAAIAVAITGYLYRAPIDGYANVGSAYAARVVCSCRFVAGRSLEDCEKDKLAGMELVTLVDDAEAKSVTARFPLVASHTATYRDGYGCVLEAWEE
ncbi:MAG: hypothetical protein QNI87_07605 [Erythrobacter sp.]|uniref:hypothetical protein n=1 Tax=Erythrobacter sp. TaxID=1042 RepID=UPI002618AD96|nr:hypothetical protein [Erythrobacter sp.]MDJ0978386.1 hypothetical protein [Erythrobacter sp.]